MRKFLFFLLVPILVYATVELDAPDSFVQGDAVTFSFSANGSNINFPEIKDIASYAVQNAGTSSQISIINGDRNEKIIKKYIFFPNKTVTIPSFEVEIDGKKEHTKSKKIVMQKASKTISKDFDITLKVNKEHVYVGEDILLTLTFKYKKDLQLYDLKFEKPDFENFWVKPIKSNKIPTDNQYVVQELNYLLFPQKSGKLEIKPLHIDAVLADGSSRDIFFQPTTKTKRIYSNDLTIDAKPLPNGASLIGAFKIKANVDKTKVKVGEAVSMQLEIDGRGNIDDLPEYKINIPNVTIYDNKAVKNFDIKDGLYGGVYKKSYSIVADSNFTIPAVTLKYFDKQSYTIKTIQTQPYKVEVIGAKIQSAPKLQTQHEDAKPIVNEKVVTKIVETSVEDKALFFILGIFSTLLVGYVIQQFNLRKSQQNETALIDEIKRTATNSQLLKKLTPYINIDEKLDKIIFEIEANQNGDLKATKKILIKLLKELKL